VGTRHPSESKSLGGPFQNPLGVGCLGRTRWKSSYHVKTQKLVSKKAWEGPSKTHLAWGAWGGPVEKLLSC
jgi:hypothetical protein